MASENTLVHASMFVGSLLTALTAQFKPGPWFWLLPLATGVLSFYWMLRDAS